MPLCLTLWCPLYIYVCVYEYDCLDMYKMNDFDSLDEEIKTHGLSHCGKLFCLLPTVGNFYFS